MSLVRPILEYGFACRNPRREGQLNTLDRRKLVNLLNIEGF